MKDADPLEELIQLLDKLDRSAEKFSHADLDELQLLSGLCKEQLPAQFISIVNSFKYTVVTETQLQFLLRLRRVMELSRKFPNMVIESNATDKKPEDALLPTFKLNKEDRERVIKLCADMRKIVFSSLDFDQPHKRRLLNRIAAIEQQVHQEKGLFDIVRGGINDLGETLEKFGVDIKPLTDRMNEVAGITRRNTEEYNQLPAPEELKQLPAPDDESQY